MKSCFLPAKDLRIFQGKKNPIHLSLFLFSEEMAQTLPSTYLITMVDYQLFNMVGSNEPTYHWIVKRNEEKKMKLFAMQMLGNEGVFEFFWSMGPSLYSFK